jgi:hypothetical protein
VRFDYLHDAHPRRFATIPEPLRTPLAALLTAIVVVGCWYALERHWLDRATDEVSRAQNRVNVSRVDVARSNLQGLRVRDLLMLDRQLREIRLSGSNLVLDIADVANHLPRGAWLTALTGAPSGVHLIGVADALPVLRDTVAGLMAGNRVRSPRLIHANRQNDAHAFAFEIQVETSKP